MEEVDRQAKVARIAMQLVENLEEVERARAFAVAEGWPAPVINALVSHANALKLHARNRVTAVLDGSDTLPG